MNTQVNRPIVSPEELAQEIDDVFTFNPPHSIEIHTSCQKIRDACKNLAKLIAQEVPEGKERTIAVNNLLSTALFASHGLTRRQILMVAVPGSPPSNSGGAEPSPAGSTPPQAPTSPASRDATI